MTDPVDLTTELNQPRAPGQLLRSHRRWLAKTDDIQQNGHDDSLGRSVNRSMRAGDTRVLYPTGKAACYTIGGLQAVVVAMGVELATVRFLHIDILEDRPTDIYKSIVRESGRDHPPGLGVDASVGPQPHLDTAVDTRSGS
ncbi:uncharacterized protein N7459_004301 [Penicillium hispanicum]|uniref:uncharacterized protein n=1 Tax=Penicillium hispanicum TaxID=1080232 RepID=UPI0025410F6D|nr:uncharacterized protein N7459_004301 [Penicillium hispanicum]KAJ5584501.1 hypothetical protein N7459_004301 [Penicillium hispanicum]